MYQNAPPGMQNFKITWGRTTRTSLQQEAETPSPTHIDAGTPHLCSGYLRFSSCLLFYKLKTLINSYLISQAFDQDTDHLFSMQIYIMLSGCSYRLAAIFETFLKV